MHVLHMKMRDGMGAAYVQRRMATHVAPTTWAFSDILPHKVAHADAGSTTSPPLGALAGP